MSEPERGRFAIIGGPLPLILPDSLTAVTEALRAAQELSRSTTRPVRVVKHYKGHGQSVISEYKNGDQQ